MSVDPFFNHISIWNAPEEVKMAVGSGKNLLARSGGPETQERKGEWVR